MYKKIALVFFVAVTVLVLPFISFGSFYSTIENFKRAPESLKKEGLTLYKNYYVRWAIETPPPSVEFPEELGLLGDYLYSDLSFNRETNLVMLHLQSYDKSTSLFGLYIDLPQYLELAGTLQYADLSCIKEKTYMVSDRNKEYLGKDFNIVDAFEPKDTVITYCKDEECTYFGGSCILIKNSID